MRQTVTPLIEQNLSLLEEDSRSRGDTELFKTLRGSDERLVEQFKLLNERVRLLNDQAITKLLQGPRFERLWEGSLAKPVGSLRQAFGDQVTFLYKDQPIGSALYTGYEIGASGGSSDIVAVADGVVTFSESFGIYGRVVALDHGLGLSTVYGSLDQAYVSRGETLRAGQRLGRMGTSGFARAPRLYFEVRIHGVPVVPDEWWENRWFFDHITEKVNEVKRALGMAVLRRIDR
jgi:murein DD-endopeptidase MepM/ murein hydrolase activator NlpD